MLYRLKAESSSDMRTYSFWHILTNPAECHVSSDGDYMATMNISLPDPLREFVEKCVREGDYSTASEYFRELVRADQKRKAEERLEQLLVEGLNPGRRSR